MQNNADTPTQTAPLLIKPHAQSGEACLRALGVAPDNGLSQAEAARRLATYGENRFETGQRLPWWIILARQFTSALIIVLFAAAIVSALVGHINDTLTILAIVVLNGILGFIQEWRAEHAIAALNEMLAPRAHVVRDGQASVIDAAHIVPGDIVVIHTGDRVPADIRLISATDLRVEEAPLTGESTAVLKTTAAVDADAPLGERASMAFTGTTVSHGRARGVVCASGMGTELGRIAHLTQKIQREPTPLERKLATLGLQLGLAAVSVSVLIALVGWLTGRGLIDMLMVGISLAVAVVPEGLPAVVTITLALGITAMARKRALIRHLQAAETLGAADVICTDKTGTLTRNEMTVTRIWMASGNLQVGGTGYAPSGAITQGSGALEAAANADLQRLGAVAAGCNNAELFKADNGEWEKLGEATEAALLVLAGKVGRFDAQDMGARIAEFSFSSRRKRMSVVVPDNSGWAWRVLVKGAPELILARCTHVLEGGQARSLDDATRAQAEAAFNTFAEDGLRTLALAERIVPADTPLEADAIEAELTLVGLVGIIDPPRESVADAIKQARDAGIQTVMITGDAGPTALAIAHKVGLAASSVVTGPEMDALSDEDLASKLEQGAIFARVAPEHKVRIVGVLQARGLRVAMTGDGVNDAPALKKANVGIAMGIRGTDVARGVADIVLTDDNYASIVAAIREGRRQYANIQKFVCYLLSSNAAEVIAICAAILIGGPLILLPVQILWMNLVTDGPTALALGVERAERDIMSRPPRPVSEPVLSRERLIVIVATSLYIGVAALVIFWACGAWSHGNLAYAQTMAFTAMIVLEKTNVLNFRTLAWHGPGNRAAPAPNPWIWLAIAGALSLQLAAIYAPPLQRALHTVPLALTDWLLLLAVALPVLSAGWLAKRFAAGFSGTGKPPAHQPISVAASPNSRAGG